MDSEEVRGIGTRTVLGQRLRELREELGASQEDIAQAVKLSRQSVSLYEKAERLPDADILKRFAVHFDVTTDYLIGLTINRNVDNRAYGDTLGLTDESIEVLRNTSKDRLYLVNTAISTGLLADFVECCALKAAVSSGPLIRELSDSEIKALILLRGYVECTKKVSFVK